MAITSSTGPKSTILDRTENLLELYIHAAGFSEVPHEFHYWSCLSMLAGAVQDRVFVKRFATSRLYPNLYVLLVGPSGCGKNVAVDMATSFANIDSPYKDNVQMFRGEITGASFITHLSAKSSKCWLVTPEMSMSIGNGHVADSFIKHMTELYSASGTEWQKRTQAYGHVVVSKPCVNWLAGTTIDWLVDCVSIEAIQSGFIGRSAVVRAYYDFDKRVRVPSYPRDYPFVYQHILGRLCEYSDPSFEGEFTLSPEADAIDEQWYHNRPSPTEELLQPTWRRQPEMVLKLAMLLSLADGPSFRIEKDHIIQAQKLVERRSQLVPQLIEQSVQMTSRKARIASGIPYASNQIMKWMKRCTTLSYARLKGKIVGEGCGLRDFRDAIDFLVAKGTIVEFEERKAKCYRWNDIRFTGEDFLGDDEPSTDVPEQATKAPDWKSSVSNSKRMTRELAQLDHEKEMGIKASDAPERTVAKSIEEVDPADYVKGEPPPLDG